MSKIAINFEAVISKKLEALCEQGESISISLGSLQGNKAIGVIRLVTKDGISAETISSIGETSLIIRPSKSYQEAPDFPTHTGPGISNMFEDVDVIPSHVEKLVGKTNPDGEEGDPHPMTRVMEEKSRPSPKDIAKAIAELRKKHQKEEAEAIALLETNATNKKAKIQPPNPTPVPPSQPSLVKPPKSVPITVKKPAALDSVMSYEELILAAGKVPGVDKPIPVVEGGKMLSRAEAIRIEESIPRMTRRAYVKNRLASELIIEDLILGGQGINVRAFTIKGNGVCDLSRIPARSLLESGQLRWCFDKNYLVFVNYEEYMREASRANDLPQSSLPIFDSIEEAESGTGMAAKTASTARLAVRSTGIDDNGEPVQGSLAMQCLEDGSAPEIPYEDSVEMDSLFRSMPKEKKPSSAKPSIQRTR